MRGRDIARGATGCKYVTAVSIAFTERYFAVYLAPEMLKFEAI